MYYLNPHDHRILLALAVADHELTNPELHALTGARMTSRRRGNLESARLILVGKVGKAFNYQPTNSGINAVAGDVQGMIRAAYRAIGGRTVRLAEIRERLATIPRLYVDAALHELATLDGVHIRAEADQQTLTDLDRAAAIVLGDDPKHTILFTA